MLEIVLAGVGAYALVVTLVAVAFWDVARENGTAARMYRQMWRERVGGDE